VVNILNLSNPDEELRILWANLGGSDEESEHDGRTRVHIQLLSLVQEPEEGRKERVKLSNRVKFFGAGRADLSREREEGEVGIGSRIGKGV